MNGLEDILDYKRQLKCTLWKLKRDVILMRDNYICQKCKKSAIKDGLNGFVNNDLILHVHHRYYQLGFLAWQYPNECYITLCESCHNCFHENRRTPIKDASGKIINFIKVCSRCGGSGIMFQYTHVQHGRCFKCKGQGLFSIFDGLTFKTNY